MADDAITQTQAATQLASQFEDDPDDSNLWGMLIPYNPNNTHISRISFYRDQPKYTIGRGSANNICFPQCVLISTKHCTIEWDGVESADSAVVLTDTSTNGTFIDGCKIGANGEGKCKILTEGCEVALGAYMNNRPDRASDDYRFIFRHKASRAPKTGIDSVYDLVHVLGRGSFGTVMKALHRQEGKWYAVKQIPTSKLRKTMTVASMREISPENTPTALKREIEIMQRLEHPNICQFKEVLYDAKNISIVLEWVKGGDFLEYLQSGEHGTGLSEPTARYFTYQICDALAYLHSLGIAHRDLKPENILLTDDVPPVVKIADFGLAKVVDSDTALKTVCGTPAYLAPEVVNGNDSYDHVVDSWSVGVIVYCMFTLCTPFVEEPETQSLARKVNERKVEWTLLQKTELSEQAENFVRGLLEEDPKARMTLTAARDHPWLAEEECLHRAGGPASLPSTGESSQRIIVTPPSQPASLRGPDVSMRSVMSVSERMALDTETPSIVMADPSQAASEFTERGMTPSIAMGDDSGSPGQDHSEHQPSSSASSGSGQRGSARLQRRADVIRQAANMGVELPAPSQEMQARALADDDDDDAP
ncbi:kinase-like domain-containing protein, partial [Daedaleopsis nitida]